MASPTSGPSPYRPLLFLTLLLILVAVPWYFAYQPAVQDIEQYLWLALSLLPLLLLLIVKFLSSPQLPTFPLPPAQPSSIHRAGGSPWGVGALLLVVLAMLWYQSTLQRSWHPAVRS